jgi:hypothetical protein
VQDGPAVNTDHGALIRITKFDVESSASTSWPSPRSGKTPQAGLLPVQTHQR